MHLKYNRPVLKRNPLWSRRLEALKLNDSFVVHDKEEKRLRAAATYFNGGQVNRQVTVNKVVGGVRCYRWR